MKNRPAVTFDGLLGRTPNEGTATQGEFSMPTDPTVNSKQGPSGVCRSDWHFWNQDLAWMGRRLNYKVPQ